MVPDHWLPITVIASPVHSWPPFSLTSEVADQSSQNQRIKSHSTPGENRETSPQSTLPDPPLSLLLRQRDNPERESSTPDGCTAHPRSASSQGIPGTSFERRNAETPRPEDRNAEWFRCSLQRKVHRLRRHSTRPHSPQRNGKSMARRPPRKHSGSPLVV